MKIKTIAALLIPAAVLFSGYAYAAKPKVDKPFKYMADLNGDGTRFIVEVLEDKAAAEPLWSITLRDRKKPKEHIDSISIPGKIFKIEISDFNFDKKQRLIVYYDNKSGVPSIDIYQLKNNKLVKIFYAASEYGIEGNFNSFARVKIGKAVKKDESPNLTPDWDTWVWVKDEFIREYRD